MNPFDLYQNNNKWLPGEAAATQDNLAAGANALGSSSVPHPEEPAKILLADDDADMRNYICRLLSRSYEVEAVADGCAALESVRKNAPDLVLADIMMPGLDGVELVRELRADPVTRTIPVILLSARADEESRVDGIVQGADAYLVKPFSARELLATIGAHLEKARVRRESIERKQDELDAVRRLSKLSTCPVSQDNLREISGEILEIAINLTGADMGTFQLFDSANAVLKITAQRGFQEPFLTFFDSVRPGYGAACGTALERRRRVIVEDVTRSSIFAGTPALDVLLAAGVRAVQSTPLVSRTGQLVGMLATHYCQPLRADEIDLCFIDLLASHSADIIAQVQAQQALRENEERFRALVTASSDVVYCMSSDWTKMLHLVGKEFIPDTDSPNTTWLDLYIHPDDQPHVLEVINEAIRTKSTFDLEHRVLRIDGTLGWTHSRAIPVFDANGEIIKWFGMASDVTLRKEAEETLRSNEEQLKELVVERTRELDEVTRQKIESYESMSDFFYALDHDLRFTYVNKGAEKTWGISRDDLLGRKIGDVFPGLIELSLSKFRQAIKEKTPQYYELYSNVTHCWVDISVYPSRNGLSVFWHDITERKLAEEALRQSEERFYKIFHQSPDMIAILRNNDNTYVDVNQVFFATTGYSSDDIIGRTPRALGIWAENKPEIEDLLQRLKKQEKSEVIECYLKTKSGEVRRVLSSIAQIELNGVDCRLEIAKDITDLRRMETEMLRLDRLNTVGEMAAAIGHEVRNPLTAVRGYLQWFQRKDKFAEYAEQLDTMIEELDRANTIITDFLSLAKNKTIELKPSNVNGVIHALYPLLQAEAFRLGHNIEADIGDIPPIYCDDNEIKQLILNLARNGLEAMDKSGILTIRTRLENDTVILAIQDTGSGIPKEVLHKIGTPFLTTKDSGTGLGLAVCYRIAERHGAKIDVETSPDGTTFTVSFGLDVSAFPD